MLRFLWEVPTVFLLSPFLNSSLTTYNDEHLCYLTTLRGSANKNKTQTFIGRCRSIDKYRGTWRRFVRLFHAAFWWFLHPKTGGLPRISTCGLPRISTGRLPGIGTGRLPGIGTDGLQRISPSFGTRGFLVRIYLQFSLFLCDTRVNRA